MSNSFKIDIEAAVKNSMQDLGLIVPKLTKEQIEQVKITNESYVAQQKSYKQVTEFISQKAKDAHTSLYKNYIATLNNVSAKLDTVSVDDASSMHSDLRSLKLDETYNLNAVWLHELFFANCFDPNSEIYMDSITYLKLQRDFGTFDGWQKDFIGCAMACGEGWAICGYNMYLKRYVNTIVSHHSSDVMMGLYPIVVMDMWAHTYFKDYLTDKKNYIIACMRELNWANIEERIKHAENVAEALK